ncbi:glutamate racemase [Ferrimonas sp. SCSIO 43195]|uniref:glutamate racemase n=1 Tax=Ferrimonas sp. SCSIO 43195 TaxID=2822844 RepID=UPI00207513F3|nr:glutamate racemase [Ferrimonas sp. SCSIO 43195]USD37820.1 glutamate racemase [Ferrimonas sp. SCSIO 43195]
MSSILLFDSGVGGLSVYSHIRQAFPAWPIHYLADNARFPYGELEDQELVSGCVALIDDAVNTLKPALVVVACNSASTLALPALRQRLSVPVIGVVPAIKPAAQLSRRKMIGLLATPGTVSRSYTDTLVDQFAADCRVLRLGSSELVRLSEGKLAGQAVPTSTLAAILQPFMADDVRPDVVVLGCTHFPLLRAELSAVLGPDVALVDSGDAIARRAQTLLSHRLEAPLSIPNRYLWSGAAPSMGLKRLLRGYGFDL